MSLRKQKPKAKISNLHVCSNLVKRAKILAGAVFAKKWPDIGFARGDAEIRCIPNNYICVIMSVHYIPCEMHSFISQLLV